MLEKLIKTIIENGYADRVLIWSACTKTDRIFNELKNNGITICGYIDRNYNTIREYNGIKVYDKSIIKNEKYFVYIGLHAAYQDIINFMIENGYKEFYNYWYPYRPFTFKHIDKYGEFYKWSQRKTNKFEYTYTDDIKHIAKNSKKYCCGCHACVNICPQKCITMKQDEEGFLYPQIDVEKCVKCGLCEKVCNSLNPLTNNNMPISYACYNKNDEVRINSSSGGVFTALAENIIDNNGIVFGAAFDDNFNVKHISVDSKEKMYKHRCSKYVQSIIGDTYSEAENALKQGRYVLFTGTPCQIDGLLKFLGKDYDNLYTHDIICKGTPSPKVWQKYLQWICQYQNNHIINTVSFRNKTYGWYNYALAINYNNDETIITPHNSDLFFKTFLENYCLRPSCYECNSKSIYRNSDITLADFWGINKILPEFYSENGVSLVLINTKKGKQLFEQISDRIEFKKTTLENAFQMNNAAYISASMPQQRDDFFEKLDKMDFDVLVRELM